MQMNLLEMFKQLSKEEQQELSKLILENTRVTIKVDGSKIKEEITSSLEQYHSSLVATGGKLLDV